MSKLATPMQQKKYECKWTAFEQEAYLQSRQASYFKVNEKTTLQVRCCVELTKNFNMFPTLSVTVGEGVVHGQMWSIQDKQVLEEKVSLY
jgi:hypothetical protein